MWDKELFLHSLGAFLSRDLELSFSSPWKFLIVQSIFIFCFCQWIIQPILFKSSMKSVFHKSHGYVNLFIPGNCIHVVREIYYLITYQYHWQLIYTGRHWHLIYTGRQVIGRVKNGKIGISDAKKKGKKFKKIGTWRPVYDEEIKLNTSLFTVNNCNK